MSIMGTQYRQYRFWISKEETELESFLENFPSVAKFLKESAYKIMRGDLVTPDQEDLVKRKLLADIVLKETQGEIKKLELIHWQTFGKSPSSQGEKAIRTGIKTKIETGTIPSCYDQKNHKFVCPECQENFIFSVEETDIAESKENFIDHYYQNHGAIPKSLEHELRVLS